MKIEKKMNLLKDTNIIQSILERNVRVLNNPKNFDMEEDIDGNEVERPKYHVIPITDSMINNECPRLIKHPRSRVPHNEFDLHKDITSLLMLQYPSTDVSRSKIVKDLVEDKDISSDYRLALSDMANKYKNTKKVSINTPGLLFYQDPNIKRNYYFRVNSMEHTLSNPYL